jgi:CHAT domain-containing protein
MYESLYPKAGYPQGHPHLAGSLGSLGFLLHTRGDYAGAETFAHRALEMRESLYPRARYPQGHPELAYSLYSLGSLLKDRGDNAGAETFSRRALLMDQQLGARLATSAPEAVALNYQASLPLFRDRYLSLTAHLELVDAYPPVWQGRANLSRVYERRHLAVLATSSDKARELWRLVSSLRRQREELLMAPVPFDAKRREEHFQNREKRLEELEQEIGRHERDLLPLVPALERYEALARSGPAQLQKALPADAVFVDWLRYVRFEQDPRTPGRKGESRTPSYVAFVLSRDKFVRVEVGPAAPIEEASTGWRQAIQEKAGADVVQRYADTLRRLLWQKVEEHIPAGTKTIYLAPDMALASLPFAALPGKRPGSVLLEDYALAVVPHGVFLPDRFTADKEKVASKSTLLAMGGVRYDRKPVSGTEVALRGAVEGKNKPLWGYLKGTETELERVVGLAKGRDVRAWQGDRASVQRLLAELPSAGHAHLATHGFFADKSFRSVLKVDEKLFERDMFASGNVGQRIGAGACSPMVLSGLVCAGANLPDTPMRGVLSADAISQLDLRRLRLAVLSACETGLGDVAGGEGVFGLQRAFHVAGCRNVVASLWKVDDEATAALMELFYRNLWHPGKPMTPLEALRQAQLAVYRHPESIPAWSKGRGPDLTTEVAGSGRGKPAGRPGAKTAPVRQWAAFVLSGPGDHGPTTEAKR